MSNEYSDIESLLEGVAEPGAVYGAGKASMPFEAHAKVQINPISSIPDFSEIQDKLNIQISPYTAISDYVKSFNDILEAYTPYTTVYTKISDSFKYLDSLGNIGLADLAISDGPKAKVRRYSLKSLHPVKQEDSKTKSAFVNDKSTSNAAITSIASSAVTGTVDINRINGEYRKSLDAITPKFLVMLKREDFEDGMENDSIKTVRGFLNQNEAVTYLWMHSLFTQNEDDPLIVAGLLRIISMTVKNEDQDSLMPIVLAALRSGNSYEQEAAVMVTEEWRSAACRDALAESLEKNHFQTEMLRGYAKMVYSELQEELELV